MTTITLLAITIETDEPFAVSAPEQGEAVNRPLTRDGNDEPYVPTTSLAGSLRSHLAAVDPALAEAMVGTDIPRTDAPPEPDRDDDRHLTPSALRLLGTRTYLSGDVTLAASTAIDRHRRAARTNTYHSAEVAPAGSTIRLYARVDRAVPPEWLDMLATWQPHVGGRRTSGHGRAHLTAIEHVALDLSTTEGRRTFLGGVGPERIDELATAAVTVAHAEDELVADITFEIVTDLAPGAHTEGGNDRPVLTWGTTPVVPGTTLKGILRSRAEYIVRTLGGYACDPHEETTRGGCANCVTCRLFGSVEGRGLLAVAGGPITDGKPTSRMHVAIDRVTGGARRNQLYSSEYVPAGSFRMQVRRLGDLPAGAEALLRGVIRDIDDGFVPIGGLGTRGYGTARVGSGSQLPDWSPIELKALVEQEAADA